MPNWCTIHLTVNGTPENVADFEAKIKSTDEQEPSAFDFNQVKATPLALINTEHDTYGLTGYDVFYQDGKLTMTYPWIKQKGIVSLDALKSYLEKESPQYREQADIYHRNILEYGFPTWYEWRLSHWGTKWTPGDVQVWRDDTGVLNYSFDTAWSFPESLFEELAVKFPDVIIQGTMEEESGDFHGEFYIREGNLDVYYMDGYREDRDGESNGMD